MLLQPIAKPAQIRRFGVHLFTRNLAGFAQSHDAGHIQRAGTHAALVAAAINLRCNLHARIAPAHIQRAHALRSVNLVTGKRQHVDVVGHHVHRNFAHGLHRIGMEDHALLVADLADLANGLQHADLVVRRHDR